MRRSRNFRQGGGSLFYRNQIVNFKEIYHFSRFQRGSNIFQGGPTFSRGGRGSALGAMCKHMSYGYLLPQKWSFDILQFFL